MPKKKEMMLKTSLLSLSQSIEKKPIKSLRKRTGKILKYISYQSYILFDMSGCIWWSCEVVARKLSKTVTNNLWERGIHGNSSSCQHYTKALLCYIIQLSVSTKNPNTVLVITWKKIRILSKTFSQFSHQNNLNVRHHNKISKYF